MAVTNKLNDRATIKSRNSIYDQLIFNEKYPVVFEAQINEKNEKIIKKYELGMKKRLLAYELKAKPKSEVNAWIFQQEIEKYLSKHHLTLRAIEQDYQRNLKAGKTDAKSIRDHKLNDAEKKLQAFESKLEGKYPKNAIEKPTNEDIQNFLNQEKLEIEKLENYKKKLENDKALKVKKLIQNLDAQNSKLKSKFEHVSKKLKDAPQMDAKTFGKDTILKIQNVKMYFGSVRAVDDISFDIKEGEIFGLIGPNGAGKSTLFNCITQFYRPTGGDVFYRDKFDNIINLTDYNTHDVLKTGIARTFQNLELVHALPVMENLLIGCHISYHSTVLDQFLHTRALKNEEAVNRALALDLLERFNLTQYKNLPTKGLSYGVLKKIELARTLMTRPRMIILDEPAAGLNDAETEELTEIIRKIRDDFNCTIFLVEHDMNLVMNVCDTVCATSFGKLLAIGTPEEIQENPVVQEAYLGMKEDEN